MKKMMSLRSNILFFCLAYTVPFSTLVYSHMHLEVYCNYLCLWTFQLWFFLFFTTMKNLQNWYLNLFYIISSVNWLLKLQLELLCMMIAMTMGPRIWLALAVTWVVWMKFKLVIKNNTKVSVSCSGVNKCSV